MSEENKDLGDKAEEAFENAKDTAGELADEAKKSANEFADSAKDALNNVTGENKKILSGILAILLGGFGIHKFILGYTKEGIIMLAVTLVIGGITCGIGATAVWIIGLVEGIIYLTKSDEDFYNTYQVGKKPWF